MALAALKSRVSVLHPWDTCGLQPSGNIEEHNLDGEGILAAMRCLAAVEEHCVVSLAVLAKHALVRVCTPKVRARHVHAPRGVAVLRKPNSPSHVDPDPGARGQVRPVVARDRTRLFALRQAHSWAAVRHLHPRASLGARQLVVDERCVRWVPDAVCNTIPVQHTRAKTRARQRWGGDVVDKHRMRAQHTMVRGPNSCEHQLAA